MRKKTGIVFMSMGAVLLVAALSLLLYNLAEDRKAGNAAAEILSSVVAAVAEPEGVTADTPGAGLAAVPGAVQEIDTEMTVVDVDGYGYIGYLSIPVLELELPIMSDWDYSRLTIAPCRYVGSTKSDDLVICGHNYNRHFGRLKTLQAGDVVTFTDMDGETVIYEVIQVETLQPTQISEMAESDYDLTLFTCTVGGATRVTVRCDRAETE